MDDPELNWPFWKFGLKRDDLFHKLHDQYNTFSSSIQDPEAFHHDVFEISSQASSADEFYRMLSDRKQQRLCELNDSYESAAFEIIANPSLINTEQWQYALQLFRTKSLDSLVRFFASYLPDTHPWHKPYCGSSSASETASTVDSVTHSHGSLFDDQDDGPIMTDEPLPMSTSLHHPMSIHLPPTPRSSTVCSDMSATSRSDDCQRKYIAGNLTPARTVSFSEPESDTSDLDHFNHDGVETVDSTPSETPSTPSSERSKNGPSKMSLEELYANQLIMMQAAMEASKKKGSISEQPPPFESETPTPRPEQLGKAFFEPEPSLPQRRFRSVSPSCRHPFIEVHNLHHDIRKVVMAPRTRRREISPIRGRWKGAENVVDRVHKPLPSILYPRPRVCRRSDR